MPKNNPNWDKTGGGKHAIQSANPNAPILLGGIEIGTTAVRMHIAEFKPDSPIRTIEELTYPITTGVDTFRHGRIQPETLRSINHILVNYLYLLDDYGVKHIRTIASAAVREAENSDILVDRIRHNTGLELEILDAVEESRLAYQALLPRLRRYHGNYSMVLNLGGGSTDIMILRGEDLQQGGAKRLGTSRLFHAFGQSGGQVKGEILQAMAANIVNSTRDAYQEYNISQLFLINRVLYRAFRSAPEARRDGDDFVIDAPTLQERISASCKLSPLEIGKNFNIGLAEVEILIPGMLILDNFIDTSEVGEVTFTNTELLTGLIIEMSIAAMGGNPLMNFRRQIVRSARAVGEKYNYDRSHARVVTEFALALFDDLRDFLELSDHDRLILEIAAVLHDVGMYVSEHWHERHGAYLVKWSDIVGLNETDRVLASQVTFFHRAEPPSREHPEYMALAKPDRMRVCKLAGILRLADVLDRSHRQSVKNVRAEVNQDKTLVYLQTPDDLGIILDALPNKADLLERVTGMQVILRREAPKSL